MTKEQIINKAIELECGNGNAKSIRDHNSTLVKVAEHLYDLMQPSLPSNLDEAAELSANDAMIKRQFPSVVYNTGLNCFNHSDLIKQFKAGAEWMAGQGVKLHGRILPGTRGNLYIESDWFDRGFGGLNYKFSDSNDVDMFVQIRKK